MIESAIVSYLAANATLAAQVGQRIRAGNLEQADALPGVVLTKINSVPDYSHDGTSGAVESLIQLSCLGTTYSDVKTLAVNVKRALRPIEQAPVQIGGPTGLLVAAAFLESEVDIPDIDEADVLSRYHVAQTWAFSHQDDT